MYYRPLEKAYPKVKPLALALIAAAQEKGATVEEFEIAVGMAEKIIKSRIQRLSIPVLVPVLEGDA